MEAGGTVGDGGGAGDGIGAGAPVPPFSPFDYPMEPVLASTPNGWAQALLGCGSWTLDPINGGSFNPADRSVSSVDPPNHRGLLTVLAGGSMMKASCTSYVCVSGPGADSVDVRLYPASAAGGSNYLGWNGSSFVPGPAVETNGCFWYRLEVLWEEPFADSYCIFFAKTYRASGAAKPFKLWAFRHVADERPSDTTPDEGSLACMFRCAEPGPFLRAELRSDVGRGPLRVSYDWLYSALNCAPGENSPFRWDFVKLADGSLALSPSEPHGGRRLYASVRPDWDYYVQVQAPGSADWITGVGADEKLSAESIAVLGVVFKGLNGRYLALNESADDRDGHRGHRVRSLVPQLVNQCAFTIVKPEVLQGHMDFLTSYRLSPDDLRATMNAYGIEGLSDAQLRELAARTPQFTPELLADVHKRYLEAGGVIADPEGLGMFVGAVVLGIAGAAIGFILAGPPGAAAGAVAGVAVGAAFGGLVLEPHKPHEDPTNTVNPGVPSIARTLVSITPTGGPYRNKKVYEDLWRLSKFPQIGDAGLPAAGCVYPPAPGNALQLWSPIEKKVRPSIVDPKEFPQLDSPAGPLTMSLFVVVKLKEDGRFQMRTHPEEALVNRGQRPNHSQLTQGSRVLGLMGDDGMYVYAAGEIFVSNDGRIRGITAKTGHYFDETPSFNANVFATTQAMLRALGYSVDGIPLGEDFWNWLSRGLAPALGAPVPA